MQERISARRRHDQKFLPDIHKRPLSLTDSQIFVALGLTLVRQTPIKMEFLGFLKN
jgi:hypothetical protein